MADEKRELAKRLDQDLESHIQNVLEKNKDFKYESGITMDNIDEVIKANIHFCKMVLQHL